MILKAHTWKQKCDAATALKMLAMMVTVGGLCIIGVYLATKGGGRDTSDEWLWTGLPPAVLGAGAWLGRKSTAILFSLFLLFVTALLIVLCFKTPPHPTVVFPIAVALMCCFPAVLTIRGWEALK